MMSSWKRIKTCPLLLLVIFSAFVELVGCQRLQTTSAWYSSFVGTTYHNVSTQKSDEQESETFVLSADGKFTFTHEGEQCEGQWPQELANYFQLFDSNGDLYSYSFDIPCDIHKRHSFSFELYPENQNSFMVTIRTESTDEETICLSSATSNSASSWVSLFIEWKAWIILPVKIKRHQPCHFYLTLTWLMTFK